MCIWGFMKFHLLTYLIIGPLISFNMPDFWPHFVSGADLGNPWVDLFHIVHTHPLVEL